MQLVDFWAQFDPYEMNYHAGEQRRDASGLLKLEEFQNPLTGLNFQGTGTLTTPLGATLLRNFGDAGRYDDRYGQDIMHWKRMHWRAKCRWSMTS